MDDSKNKRKVFQVEFKLDCYTLIDIANDEDEAKKIIIDMLKKDVGSVDIRISVDSPFDVKVHALKADNSGIVILP